MDQVKIMHHLIFLLSLPVILSCNPIDLQRELEIHLREKPLKETCQIYLIHHGSTEWSEQSRLQGWTNLPLSLKGKEQIHSLADRIQTIAISTIYSSPAQSSLETSKILQQKLNCHIIEEQAFLGEFHGDFEGFTKEQYTNEPHFQFYDSLPPEREIFYPCGKNGESKVEVARRIIPALKRIAIQNTRKNIAVVTHGGIFKFLNFYLGNSSDELGTVSIPHGEMMRIEMNDDGIYLYSFNQGI